MVLQLKKLKITWCNIILLIIGTIQIRNRLVLFANEKRVVRNVKIYVINKKDNIS